MAPCETWIEVKDDAGRANIFRTSFAAAVKEPGFCPVTETSHRQSPEGLPRGRPVHLHAVVPLTPSSNKETATTSVSPTAASLRIRESVTRLAY